MLKLLSYLPQKLLITSVSKTFVIDFVILQTEVNAVGRQPTSSFQTVINGDNMLDYYSVFRLARINQVKLLEMWLAGRQNQQDHHPFSPASGIVACRGEFWTT
jgi:hypothetical protein